MVKISLPRSTLHLRITLVILIVVSITNIAFAYAIYIASHEIKDSLLRARMDHEVEEIILYLHSESETESVLPKSESIQVYLRSRAHLRPIPAVFAQRDPGYFHGVVFEGRNYLLVVRDLSGDRAYVAVDVSLIEEEQEYLEGFLLVGALLTPALAIWMGYWLSRRIIAPVSRLADQLSKLDPGQRNVRLTHMYRGYEVELIARSFDRYMERMDSFVRREQLFTAAASHELRTPLSVISTSAELLSHSTSLSKHEKQTLMRIMRVTHDITELVGALLFLSREPHEIKLNTQARTELASLVTRLIEYQHPQVADRAVSLQFKVDEPAVVQAPEGHVSIAIGNLLRNAVFNTEVGSIDILVKGAKVTITDTGEGISPQDLEHIFECRYRGHQSSGSGLGLYLAKSVCDRYGWEIVMSSEPGKGTMASIEFS